MAVNYGCDQGTKQIARTQLSEMDRHSYLNNMFQLTLAENRGAFLSAGSDLEGGWRWLLLKILPLVVLIGMAVYLVTSNAFTRAQFVCMACVLGGGLSNVVDRILTGSVTDFMIFGIGGLHTGIVNFADLSITLGMIAFLLFSFLQKPPNA